MSKQLVTSLKLASIASMPRRRQSEGRKENYWWNETIAVLRKVYFKARRKYQWSKTSLDYIIKRTICSQFRRKHKKAIVKSKTSSFNSLCIKSDENTWGSAYRIVIASLKGTKSAQTTCPELVDKIFKTLFPDGESYDHNDQETANVIPQDVEVSEEEVLKLCPRIGNKNDTGKNSFPNKALYLDHNY